MIRSLVVSVFVFATGLLPAAVPLVNLVDERTLFAVSVTDTPALLAGWDRTPLATTWNDPQFVKFLAPMRAELKVDEWDAETKAATGLTVRELLALAEGEALFALPSFDFTTFEGENPPPFLIALQVGKQAGKIEKLLADSAAKESIKEETETFSGVPVKIRPLSSEDKNTDETETPRSVAWAIVDGVWLLSLDKERVFAAIDAVKQGGVDAALGKSERFLRTRERVGAAQALVYLNLPAIYPGLRDLVSATKAKAKSAGKTNPLAPDPEVMFNALGLDAFGEAYLSLLIDENETRIDAGLAYAEERGLLKLIAYQPGPVAKPDWIPAKWPSVSSMRFSVPKLYAGLEELLQEISPLLSVVAQGRINEFNKKVGIDIKRDLIGSLGDEILSARAIPPGVEPGQAPAWQEMDQLIAVSLSNEPAFIKSVEALKQLAGPAAEQMFSRRDYLGHTIYTFNQKTAPDAPPPRGVTYAIANRTLLLGIGSPATVENALQGMAAAEGLFWKRDDVKAVLAEVPADAVIVQVQDLRVMAASFVEMAVQLQTAQSASDEGGVSGKKFVDVTARPDAEAIARHWGLTAGYAVRTPEGIFSVSRFTHPKK